jgi:uncharacterized protein involved in propanediol utilization
LSGCCGSVEGRAIGHAGEILQGVYPCEGEWRPFLVTLPAPPFVSIARPGPFLPNKAKARRAAAVASRSLGHRESEPSLSIETRMPISRGCGSSTADCVAAIRAVLRHHGASATPEQIAAWTHSAEAATDATMFDLTPVAFRPRCGRVLRYLGDRFPRLCVTVTDLGGPDIDTLAVELPRYSQEDAATFARLLDDLREDDAAAYAHVATASARIHQRHRPHPRWAAFTETSVGSLGIGRSHSGSIATVLTEGPAPDTEARLREAGFPILASYQL